MLDHAEFGVGRIRAPDRFSLVLLRVLTVDDRNHWQCKANAKLLCQSYWNASGYVYLYFSAVICIRFVLLPILCACCTHLYCRQRSENVVIEAETRAFLYMQCLIVCQHRSTFECVGLAWLVPCLIGCVTLFCALTVLFWSGIIGGDVIPAPLPWILM